MLSQCSKSISYGIIDITLTINNQQNKRIEREGGESGGGREAGGGGDMFSLYVIKSLNTSLRNI